MKKAFMKSSGALMLAFCEVDDIHQGLSEKSLTLVDRTRQRCEWRKLLTSYQQQRQPSINH